MECINMKNITDYIKLTKRNFKFLASPESRTEKTDFVKACRKANSKTLIFDNDTLNTQHLQISHIPKMMITGEFRKHYNLSLTELLFLLFITDNKNTEDLENTNKNDWIYYYKTFDYITSNLTTQKQTINSLKDKGFINIKFLEETGFYIDYTPTIDKYNELFDNILENKAIRKKQLNYNDKQKAEKKQYINNLKEYFPVRYKAYKTIQTSEYKRINEMANIDNICDIQNTFCFIPVFLKTQHTELANKLDTERRSPLLYFVQHLKEYEYEYFDFLQSAIFMNKTEPGEEPGEEPKQESTELDRLLSMI